MLRNSTRIVSICLKLRANLEHIRTNAVATFGVDRRVWGKTSTIIKSRELTPLKYGHLVGTLSMSTITLNSCEVKFRFTMTLVRPHARTCGTSRWSPNNFVTLRTHPLSQASSPPSAASSSVAQVGPNRRSSTSLGWFSGLPLPWVKGSHGPENYSSFAGAQVVPKYL